MGLSLGGSLQGVSMKLGETDPDGPVSPSQTGRKLRSGVGPYTRKICTVRVLIQTKNRSTLPAQPHGNHLYPAATSSVAKPPNAHPKP